MRSKPTTVRRASVATATRACLIVAPTWRQRAIRAPAGAAPNEIHPWADAELYKRLQGNAEQPQATEIVRVPPERSSDADTSGSDDDTSDDTTSDDSQRSMEVDDFDSTYDYDDDDNCDDFVDADIEAANEGADTPCFRREFELRPPQQLSPRTGARKQRLKYRSFYDFRRADAPTKWTTPVAVLRALRVRAPLRCRRLFAAVDAVRPQRRAERWARRVERWARRAARRERRRTANEELWCARLEQAEMRSVAASAAAAERAAAEAQQRAAAVADAYRMAAEAAEREVEARSRRLDAFWKRLVPESSDDSEEEEEEDDEDDDDEAKEETSRADNGGEPVQTRLSERAQFRRWRKRVSTRHQRSIEHRVAMARREAAVREKLRKLRNAQLLTVPVRSQKFQRASA